MWICLNNAFFSIVEPKPSDPAYHEGKLLVRARRPGDLEAVFGKLAGPVEKRPERDYLFRAYIPRNVVVEIIAGEIMGIDYSNFKNSVRDPKLHDAYASFWHSHARLQPTRPYSGVTQRHDLFSAPAAKPKRQPKKTASNA